MDPLVIGLAVLVLILTTALVLLYLFPQSCPECESNTCPECETTECPTSNVEPAGESSCKLLGYTKLAATDIAISKSNYCETQLAQIETKVKEIINLTSRTTFIKKGPTVYGGQNLIDTKKATIDAWISTAKNTNDGSPLSDEVRKIIARLGLLPGDSTADSTMWLTLDDTNGGVTTGTGTYQMFDSSKVGDVVRKFLKEDPAGDYKKYC